MKKMSKNIVLIKNHYPSFNNLEEFNNNDKKDIYVNQDNYIENEYIHIKDIENQEIILINEKKKSKCMNEICLKKSIISFVIFIFLLIILLILLKINK